MPASRRTYAHAQPLPRNRLNGLLATCCLLLLTLPLALAASRQAAFYESCPNCGAVPLYSTASPLPTTERERAGGEDKGNGAPSGPSGSWRQLITILWVPVLVAFVGVALMIAMKYALYRKRRSRLVDFIDLGAPPQGGIVAHPRRLSASEWLQTSTLPTATGGAEATGVSVATGGAAVAEGAAVTDRTEVKTSRSRVAWTDASPA